MSFGYCRFIYTDTVLIVFRIMCRQFVPKPMCPAFQKMYEISTPKHTLAIIYNTSLLALPFFHATSQVLFQTISLLQLWRQCNTINIFSTSFSQEIVTVNTSGTYTGSIDCPIRRCFCSVLILTRLHYNLRNWAACSIQLCRIPKFYQVLMPLEASWHIGSATSRMSQSRVPRLQFISRFVHKAPLDPASSLSSTHLGVMYPQIIYP